MWFPQKVTRFGNTSSVGYLNPCQVLLPPAGPSTASLRALTPSLTSSNAYTCCLSQRILLYCKIQLILLKGFDSSSLFAPQCFSYSSCAGGLNVVGIAVKCAKHTLYTQENMCRHVAATDMHAHTHKHVHALSHAPPFLHSFSPPLSHFCSQSPSIVSISHLSPPL